MSNIPRPQGHHVLTPSSVTNETAAVIAFLQEAFSGKVVDQYDGADGTIHHAEVLVGDSVLMLGSLAPKDTPRPTQLTVYLDDADAVAKAYERAIGAGAKSVDEPTTKPWGYHSGCVTDVGGNQWTICAIVEALSHDEIEARMRSLP
jgi:PhnB protein